MSNIIGTARVCIGCMLTDQQGEVPADQDPTQPKPWCKLADGESSYWVMGSAHGPLDADCNASTEEDHYTDCGHDDFSRSQCGGCGTYLAGERFDYVIFDS